MKKLLIAIMVILLPVLAYASPFIVCDPYPTTVEQPDYFNVTLDGGAVVQSTPQAVTGGLRLHFDLSGISNGTHNMTVAACNEWGCSSTVPFGFTKAVPGAPANTRLSSE